MKIVIDELSSEVTAVNPEGKTGYNVEVFFGDLKQSLIVSTLEAAFSGVKVLIDANTNTSSK